LLQAREEFFAVLSKLLEVVSRLFEGMWERRQAVSESLEDG
jgi:hypothetical protein